MCKYQFRHVLIVKFLYNSINIIENDKNYFSKIYQDILSTYIIADNRGFDFSGIII